MIYPLAAICASLILWAALTQGTGAALARGWMLALLSPVWIVAQVASTEFDLRSIAAAMAVGCLAIVRDWRWKSRLCWSDVAAALLIFAQLAAEYKNGAFGPKVFVQTINQWALPYLLGRLMFRTPAESRRALPIVGVLCVVLSLWVISESILRVNLFNHLLGRSGSFQSETEIRWGLRRAEGPTTHPIACGMLLVLLFPWALQAARAARDGLGRGWWRALPWLCGAAVICSMSRGPQLALLFTLLTTIYFHRPKFRRVLLIAIFAFAYVLYLGQGMVLHVLHSWSHEADPKAQRITIGGQEYEYSSTTHRLLQVFVFQDAMAHAGMLGFGGKALSQLPLDIPYVEPNLLTTPFNSIDNHYIYFILQAGYLGIASFLLLGLLSLAHLWRPARNAQDEDVSLAAGMFGAQLAVMLALLSVFFSYDFSFQWLFNCGYAASWHLYAFRRPDASSRPSFHRVATRLVPGHPQWKPGEFGRRDALSAN